MMNQFYKICRDCGKQILMTRCEETGRWMPCDSLIMRFTPAGGPETYINEDGKLCRGYRSKDGEFGYKNHRRSCSYDHH